MKIQSIDSWQIFDSRGHPTLEVEVRLEDGSRGVASVPSGASTGIYEAVELRDGEGELFDGLSVYRAIESVKDRIAPVLIGNRADEQETIDQLMIDLDGTGNKRVLGANSIVGVSMAVSKAAADSNCLPLFDYLGGGQGTSIPVPEIQIIGGGAHSQGRIDVQDFMIICTGADSLDECLEMTFNVYRRCGELLQSQGKLAGVADEGGYWPDFKRNRDALDVLLKSIEKAGYRAGEDISISLDIAASEFFNDGCYHLNLEQEELEPEAFYEWITGICKRYPVVSIEDPFAETDLTNWSRFTEEFGQHLQIIGDDLFTTDTNRVREGQFSGLANAVLIKLNQIGTVTETMKCIDVTKKGGWSPVVSARSGETEDPYISHLAVATNAGQLKVGSFSRSERMVKWNELIRINRQLGTRAMFKPFKDVCA